MSKHFLINRINNRKIPFFPAVNSLNLTTTNWGTLRWPSYTMVNLRDKLRSLLGMTSNTVFNLNANQVICPNNSSRISEINYKNLRIKTTCKKIIVVAWGFFFRVAGGYEKHELIIIIHVHHSIFYLISPYIALSSRKQICLKSIINHLFGILF